jgi:hypothetical protein
LVATLRRLAGDFAAGSETEAATEAR